MKHLSFLFLLILIGGFIGCTSLPDAFIYFRNNSSTTVFVSRNCAYPVDSTTIFKQDIERWDKIPSGKSTRYPAEPGLYFEGYGGSWNLILNETDGYVSFYVIDCSYKDTLDNHLQYKDYPVLVRYDLTIDDLEGLNYIVEYPPIEQMQSVHMYPPYETVVAKD